MGWRPSGRTIVELLAVMTIVVVFGYYQLSYAGSVDDYISDEVWYVSSSRNYLNKVFGVYPSVGAGLRRVTLELRAASRGEYLSLAERVGEEVRRLGGVVVKSSEYYGVGDNPLYAVCADIPEEALGNLTSFLHVRAFGVGYCYPNAGNILDYMNLEHPPLGKYFVALSMLACGDRPLCWRLPSILSGTLILVLQYLLLRRLLEGPWGGALAVVAPLVTAFDRTFRSMTVVAMLESPLALFTYLTCFYSLLGSTRRSALFLSLAFSTKFSGAFVVPALYPEYSRRVPPALSILLLVYGPLLSFVALSIPLVVYRGGFLRWWSEAVEGALRWHLSTKVEPGKGPPAASPWEWLAGLNPFVLRYKYEEGIGFVVDLAASGNPVLYLATLALSVYVIPKLKSLPDGGSTWAYTWLTWAMYVLLWFAGNRSQYSFYMAQLAPLLYTLLGISVYYLSYMENLIEVARAWRRLLENLARYLRGEVGLRIRLELEARQARSVLT